MSVFPQGLSPIWLVSQILYWDWVLCCDTAVHCTRTGHPRQHRWIRSTQRGWWSWAWPKESWFCRIFQLQDREMILLCTAVQNKMHCTVFSSMESIKKNWNANLRMTTKKLTLMYNNSKPTTPSNMAITPTWVQYSWSIVSWQWQGMSSSRSAQSLVAAESIEISTHQIDFSKQNTPEDANMTDTLESLTSPGADHHEHKESPQLWADATNQVNNALSVPNWMHSTAPEGTPCDPSMPSRLEQKSSVVPWSLQQVDDSPKLEHEETILEFWLLEITLLLIGSVRTSTVDTVTLCSAPSNWWLDSSHKINENTLFVQFNSVGVSMSMWMYQYQCSCGLVDGCDG